MNNIIYLSLEESNEVILWYTNRGYNIEFIMKEI
jgi:hypothetical protein